MYLVSYVLRRLFAKEFQSLAITKHRGLEIVVFMSWSPVALIGFSWLSIKFPIGWIGWAEVHARQNTCVQSVHLSPPSVFTKRWNASNQPQNKGTLRRNKQRKYPGHARATDSLSNPTAKSLLMTGRKALTSNFHGFLKAGFRDADQDRVGRLLVNPKLLRFMAFPFSVPMEQYQMSENQRVVESQ